LLTSIARVFENWLRPTPRPWRLIETHRFEEALVAYNNEQGEEPADLRASNRATALMGLERYEEAIDNLRMAEPKAPDPRGSPYREKLAVLHWLCGRQQQAQEMLLSKMAAIQCGDDIWRDFAGGAKPGLLLWYMSVTLEDLTGMARSKEYLQWLVRTSDYRLWPMPLAEYVVGARATDELPRIVTKKTTLAKALAVAGRGRNILMRRELCGVFFYQAVEARLRKAEAEAMRLFHQAVALKDPIQEMEWHLARAEIRQQMTQMRSEE
jgi:hypothetical protein